MNKTGNMQKFHYGLTSQQVEERKKSGLVNYEVKPKFKTKKQILFDDNRRDKLCNRKTE